MSASDKQNRSDCTPDLACTRCRERKIRCGRERPQCSNCDREDGVTCVYQNPVKRVNHLKLLCDSVEILQERLQTIESHLGRLSSGLHSGLTSEGAFSAPSSSRGSNSVGERVTEGNDRDESDNGDDDEVASDSLRSLHDIDMPDLQVFRSHSHMLDRYHGRSSLFVLCSRFRLQALATSSTNNLGALREMLQNVCDIAGSTEPFPSFGDHPPIKLLPQKQAVTAVGHFIQHVDCTTDIFVPQNLMSNLERVYSQPQQPGDDAWAVCFNVITLLVLGMEISTQAPTALVGDFARSLLPSRAALVSSRLLTTPRLINVQTLILLSVAAQQLDPSGWGDLILAHACMLARTMGLHHTGILPSDPNNDGVIERAKVFRSLYTWDKSLCTTRGSVAWLPSYDSNINSEISVAVEHQAPYAERLRLAVIQDEIYRMSNEGTGRRQRSSRKLQSALKPIEKKLDEYARISGIADCRLPESACAAQLHLEFLATRILALQHGSEPRHIQQVQCDARASCLLLLFIHGDRSTELIEAFRALNGRTQARSVFPPTMASDIPFGNILDSFSIPAISILLEGLLHSADGDSEMKTLSDMELLQKTSACYHERTARMQHNSYHRVVSIIFDQLLAILDRLKSGPSMETAVDPPSVSMSDPQATHSLLQSLSMRPPIDNNISTEDISNMAYWQTPASSTSIPWENWLSMPSSFGPATPLDTADLEHIGTSSDGDMHILSADDLTNCSDQMNWDPCTPERRASLKRPRTDEGSERSARKNAPSPLSTLLAEEMPFHLI